MNNSYIKHQGVVDHIEGENVFVKILNVSACSSCHAKGACSASDMQEKMIEAKSKGRLFQVGQQVMIISTEGKGFLALFWGYVAPFLLVVITLIVLTALRLPEVKAGLYALLTLVPYYGGLYVFKQKFRNQFTFDIQ